MLSVSDNNNIRKIRVERGLTQDEVAKALGWLRRDVSLLERGKCPVSLRVALNLARLFECCVEEIFSLEEQDD